MMIRSIFHFHIGKYIILFGIDEDVRLEVE